MYIKSYYLSEITLDIRNKKYYFDKNEQLVHFGSNYTFLKMKCNPTNKITLNGVTEYLYVSNVLKTWYWLSDIDECAIGAENDCDVHSLCTNLPGSYTCQCIPGYTGPGHWCEGRVVFCFVVCNIWNMNIGQCIVVINGTYLLAMLQLLRVNSQWASALTSSMTLTDGYNWH